MQRNHTCVLLICLFITGASQPGTQKGWGSPIFPGLLLLDWRMAPCLCWERERWPSSFSLEAPVHCPFTDSVVVSFIERHNWSCSAHSLFGLASFSRWYAFQVPPCVFMTGWLIPLQPWIITHCLARPQFIYPSPTQGHLDASMFWQWWISLL